MGKGLLKLFLEKSKVMAEMPDPTPKQCLWEYIVFLRGHQTIELSVHKSTRNTHGTSGSIPKGTGKRPKTEATKSHEFVIVISKEQTLVAAERNSFDGCPRLLRGTVRSDAL